MYTELEVVTQIFSQIKFNSVTGLTGRGTTHGLIFLGSPTFSVSSPPALHIPPAHISIKQEARSMCVLLYYLCEDLIEF